jgi:hypothetical protein
MIEPQSRFSGYPLSQWLYGACSLAMMPAARWALLLSRFVPTSEGGQVAPPLTLPQ